MKRASVRRLGLLVVGFGVLVYGADARQVGDEASYMKEIRNLREDISLCNLLNGLYLSEEQSRGVMACAKEADALRQQYLKGHEVLAEQIRGAFTDLRHEVMAGTGIRDEIGKRASHLNEKEKEAREAYQRDLKRIEGKVTALLTEGQKQTIEDFKPCLLPPRTLNEPVRAGQAASNAAALDKLRQVRAMPARTYQNRKSQFVDRHLDNLEKHHYITFTPEERAAERERVGAVLDRARGMSDVEFSLNDDAIADELAKPIVERDEKIKQGAKLLARGDLPSKLGRFLLDPRIIPILEERLAKGSSYKTTQMALLKKVEPAENGDGGKYAINRGKQGVE